jgi:hypothetical protein
MFCIKGNLDSDSVDTALVSMCGCLLLGTVHSTRHTSHNVPQVTMQHFDSAFSVVFPSVSKQDERRCATWMAVTPHTSHLTPHSCC